MTDRDRWELRGPVRSCRLERTWEQHGDTAVVEFRPDGALSSRRHVNFDGSEWRATSEYDAEGRLLFVRNESPSGPLSTRRFEYDSSGRLIRVIERSADGRDRLSEEYEYDATRLKKKTHYVDTPVSRSGSFSLVTDGLASEQPAEVELQDSNGRVMSRVELTYDAAGRSVSEKMTNLADIPSTENMPAAAAAALRELVSAGATQQHRYDDRGRRVETVVSWGPLGWNRRTFAYNEHDDKIEEISEDDHRGCTIEDDGRLTETSEGASSNHSEARFRYEYDSHGNWITKVVEHRNGADGEFAVSTRERRTLVYF
jgi:YD repeat-containing protein